MIYAGGVTATLRLDRIRFLGIRRDDLLRRLAWNLLVAFASPHELPMAVRE